MDNDLCREVLGAHTYETAPTTDHPEGQILSNWFLRRIEDKDTGGLTVMGAKTGYVVQSGNCAASCGSGSDDGQPLPLRHRRRLQRLAGHLRPHGPVSRPHPGKAKAQSQRNETDETASPVPGRRLSSI